MYVGPWGTDPNFTRRRDAALEDYVEDNGSALVASLHLHRPRSMLGDDGLPHQRI